MLPEEIQKHLDAIDADDAALQKVRQDATVQSTVDKLLVAAEPFLLTAIDEGEIAVAGAVPGGPLGAAGLKLFSSLLEDGLKRWIEKKKIAP